MERTFAMRLTDLRKESGISQKDAAAALGVSQALLSHYEKGIRECGLDFVARASDYYDVTCDYLLGKSSFKSWFSEENLLKKEIPEDKILNSQTASRAASYLRERMKNENSANAERLMKFYTMGIYSMMLAWINAGYLPKSWLIRKNVANNSLYSKCISAISIWLLDIEKNPAAVQEEETPLFIKNLISEMDAYVNSVNSQLMEISSDQVQ